MRIFTAVLLLLMAVFAYAALDLRARKKMVG